MRRKVLQILGIFIIGILGGLFANQFIWPYFIERPVYVTERKEIIIQENTALKNAIEKVEKTVISVKTTLQTGEVLQGSGLILTSDGVIVTLVDLVPQGASFSFYIEGKPVAYQILKRDLTNNLALVKLDGNNLPTVGFADFGKLKLGERVFLVGIIHRINEFKRGVNEGVVTSFDDNLIITNIFEVVYYIGSPLFNIDGEILGLNNIDYWGRISSIPIDKIKAFAGF